MNKPQVTVIGGLTMDLTYKVKEWPHPKQAIQASAYYLSPGGKGFNQASAISRMGLGVNFITSVGDDKFADTAISELQTENIDNKCVIHQKNTLTDLVTIIIGQDANPSFIGIRNATSKLTVSDIKRFQHLIESSNVLLVNSEVSPTVALEALKIAKNANVTTIFNPAPPEKFPIEMLTFTDYFVPNEWEAKKLAGNKSHLSSSELAKYYHKFGTKVACVTMGENGCVVATNNSLKSYLAFPIKEVDATGAGDAFCGTLAYSVSQGWDIHKTIRYASAAGAIACTKIGSRNAPTITELTRFINKNKHVNI